MGRKGKGRKFYAVTPQTGTAAQARPPQACNWRSAGAGYRLGGADNVEATRAPGRASSHNSIPNLPNGLRRVQERGDGNCLFHAIARQQLGDTNLASRVRIEICDWMQAYLLPSAVLAGLSPLTTEHLQMVQEQRAEVFAPDKRESDRLMLRYVQRMRRDGEWGTGLEALCAAYLYHRPVHIWSPAGASTLEPLNWRPSTGSDPLRLLHNGQNHWDSAIPLQNGAAMCQAPMESCALEELSCPVCFDLNSGACEESSQFENDHSLSEERALQRTLAASAADYDRLLAYDPLDEERELQRALAVSAADMRQQREAERGVNASGRAAELRISQEKNTLLGQLAERCARRGEEMPIGAGLVSLERLRALVEARAPKVTIDGVELSKTSSSIAGQSGTGDMAIAAEVPVSAKATGCKGRRWGQRKPCDSDATNESANFLCDQAAVTAAENECDEHVIREQLAVLPPVPLESPVLRLRLVEDGADLDDCLAWLSRLGVSAEEAADIVAACDGDVSRVKALYGTGSNGEEAIDAQFP